MADLAKYQQGLEKFNTSYAKEALKETWNFWGLAGFLIAAAYTVSVFPLLVAIIAEIVYLLVVPNLPAYRALVQGRERERLIALHKSNRDKLIKSFTPREREAVEWSEMAERKDPGQLQKIHRCTRIAIEPSHARSALGRFCRSA